MVKQRQHKGPNIPQCCAVGTLRLLWDQIQVFQTSVTTHNPRTSITCNRNVLVQSYAVINSYKKK